MSDQYSHREKEIRKLALRIANEFSNCTYRSNNLSDIQNAQEALRNLGILDEDGNFIAVEDIKLRLLDEDYSSEDIAEENALVIFGENLVVGNGVAPTHSLPEISSHRISPGISVEVNIGESWKIFSSSIELGEDSEIDISVGGSLQFLQK